MPGLCGLISKKPQAKNIEDLRLMVESIRHEPFYTSGTCVNEQEGLYLYAGWVSHQDSFSDCMPIFNERKDVVLFFTGENFSDRVVINQLRESGHDFDSSNASYLVHLYEEEGEKFINNLNGWFSGILGDLRQNKLVLFNDRYAMHRIYYYEDKDAFYFSSEAKALLKVCPEVRRIDPAAAGELLTCGSVLENKSLFLNMHILPGSSAWTFHKSGRVDKKSYFDFTQWENQGILDKEVFYNEFREVFQGILPRYFRSKNPVAVSLTGGLDTRMIMSSVKPGPKALPCYTFAGMFRDCYDTRIARKIALTCRQPYSVLNLDRGFLKDFPKHAERTIYITDGCVDVSVSHEIYLNNLAREIAPIRMTGNYGSEVLRSVNYIKAAPPIDGLIHNDFKSYISNAVNQYRASADDHKLTYAVTKLIPWHLYGRLSAAQSQLTVRTPYMDNALVQLFYRAPEDVRKDNAISRRLIRDGDPHLASIMTDRGVSIDTSNILLKTIRAYREVLFRAEYFYNEGTPDWMTRFDHVMRPVHPERIMLGHHKIEHYRHWFCTELADYMSDIIMDPRTQTRPYWNRQFLTSIVGDHIKGRRNHIQAITKILAIELIHRTLLENI